MSKLRELYDKLYIQTEVWLLARYGTRTNRKWSKTVPMNPRVEREYNTTVRAYWRQFRVRTPKKFWFRLLCSGHAPFSPKHIPDDLWRQYIIPHYNNLIFAKAWQDKCMDNVLFPDVRRPESLVKNIAGVFYDDELHLLTRQEAIARCKNAGRILVKPSVGSGGGDNIRFYDSDSLSDRDVEDIFDRYGSNYLVQKKMGQHETLEAMNPRSLNTIRLITFLHENQVHILTAFLRVGAGASEVDNTSQGGYKCNVTPDGRLMEYAVTKTHGRWEYVSVHPSGTRFADVVIPSWDRVTETVRTQAARMAHFKIIGWDIAVSPDGDPTLIEFNIIPAPGYCTDGPLFGDLTDQVLEEVFGRRKHSRPIRP